ncbi:MAG TPA: hypothetical protein PLP23_03680 [Panacibacter sp.]|nr:hypothetical protein [Panacibacter sp.]
MKFFLTIFFSGLLFCGCQKASSVSVDAGIALPGTYNATGTITTYSGQIKDSIIIRITPINLAKDFLGNNDTELVCGYALLGSSGWNYIIDLNSDKQSVKALDANETILTSITANSWQSISAAYDEATSTFHFLTLYKNGSGNDVLVNEFLKKQ